jgi:hypothetical protein
MLGLLLAAAAVVSSPADPAWLETPGGAPLFVCGLGDPEDFLYREDQEAIVRRLAETGANGIYVQAIRSHGGDGPPTQNPFVRNDPRRGLAPEVLERWRGRLRALDAAGVVTWFFVYDDGACVWGCDRARDHAVPPDEEAFLRSLAAAFPDVPRLVWVVAEEYQERFSRERASAIARVLREADPLGRPVGVHQLPGLSFDLAGDPDVSVFAMQYGNAESTARELHDAVVEARRLAEGRYHVTMSEIPYKGLGSGEEARRKVWAMAMGGAYVLANGWDGLTTPRARLRECALMVRFFEEADPRGLAPRDDLALGATEYVLAAEDGRRVAYASRTGADRTMGLRALARGRYDLLWLDPATGIRAVRKGVDAEGDTLWPVPVTIGPEAALVVRPSPETGD